MIFPSYLYLKPITLTIYTICLSETYLDSFDPYDGPRLNLSGYELVRADNLSNHKRVDVGICFKDTLAVRPAPLNTLKEFLQLERECLLLEIRHDLYYDYIDRRVNHKTSFTICCFC